MKRVNGNSDIERRVQLWVPEDRRLSGQNRIFSPTVRRWIPGAGCWALLGLVPIVPGTQNEIRARAAAAFRIRFFPERRSCVAMCLLRVPRQEAR
jgi:hypothetical protein